MFTIIGLAIFCMFRFFGWGCHTPSPIIFAACKPIATKFCSEIDNQSVSSNIETNLHNINAVIDGDVIMLRNLAKKTVK